MDVARSKCRVINATSEVQSSYTHNLYKAIGPYADTEKIITFFEKYRNVHH